MIVLFSTKGGEVDTQENLSILFSNIILVQCRHRPEGITPVRILVEKMNGGLFILFRKILYSRKLSHFGRIVSVVSEG